MKDLFLEFLSMNWNGHGNRTTRLEDVALDDYVIARISEDGIEVRWLANGNKLNISWEIVDMFSSFNTLYGERVLWIGKGGHYESTVDKMIYKLTLLVNQFNWGRGPEFLSTLADICELGTQEFFKWIQEESGEKLQPMELTTVDGIIKI